jgi:hypothetical protein
MKRTMLLIAIAGFALMSFKAEIDKSQAKAQQVKGMYVYLYSDPANTYDILGQVKKSGVMKNISGERQTGIIEDLADKAHKEYPSGDGIIVQGPDLNQAEVIKFR